MKRLGYLLAAGGIAIGAVGVVTMPPAGAAPAWLDRLNQYRAEFGVPLVTEDPALSSADAKHVAYMIATDTFEHAEDPASPFFTPEGDTAARRSNLAFGSSSVARPLSPDPKFIDGWMTAPFHLLGMLHPRLTASGFASGQAADQRREYAALDVLSTRAPTTPPSVSFPLLWPNERSAPIPTQMFRVANESPDPLDSCPGYVRPAGLPLILQLGAAAATPASVTATLTRDGAVVESCTAREAGASTHTSFIIPRAPLVAASRYDITATVDGRTITWAFVTEGFAGPSPTPSATPSTTASPTPTSSAAPPLLTLSRSAATIVAGSTVTLTGAATSAGQPLSGRIATLEMTPAVGPPSTVAATTDVNGRVSLQQRPSRTTRFRLLLDGAASAPVDVGVQVRVTETVRALTGCRIRIEGATFPGQPYRPVYIYRKDVTNRTIYVGYTRTLGGGNFGTTTGVQPCGVTLGIYSTTGGVNGNLKGYSATIRVITRR